MDGANLLPVKIILKGCPKSLNLIFFSLINLSISGLILLISLSSKISISFAKNLIKFSSSSEMTFLKSIFL